VSHAKVRERVRSSGGDREEKRGGVSKGILFLKKEKEIKARGLTKRTIKEANGIRGGGKERKGKGKRILSSLLSVG